MGKYCNYHIEECVYRGSIYTDQQGWYCPQCGRKLSNEEIIELEPCEIERFKRTTKRKYCKCHIEMCEYLYASSINKRGWYCQHLNQKLSDDEIIELDAHGAEAEKLLLQKKKKHFRLTYFMIAILCIVAYVYILPCVIMGLRIHAFNRLVKHHEECDFRIEMNFDYDRYNDNYRHLTNYCGLGNETEESNDYVMDVSFVETYIDMYSAEEFIEKLYYIYDNLYPHCESYYINCGPRTINAALTKALDYAGIERDPFTLPEAGTEGYYTVHTEEVPESKTWEVSGSFYSSNGENRHTQTRTCSSTVTVHGDFLIEHRSDYSYHEGAYEWRNGVFYDELPRWEHYTIDYIYYKGKLLNENIYGAEIFYIGDTCYILYGPEECDDSRHKFRDWEILEQ